jgi:hypothetical protein
MGGPADTTLRIPPQKPAVSRRGQQQEEEPNILRRAHVDDTEEGAPRHSRAVDLDRPSDDAGPTPEEVDLRAISTPAPEPEPELAIERTIKPAPPSDDHSRAAAEDVDGPVVDGNEDPDREVTPIASTPRPRSTSRSPRRPPRAEHDGGPHITVTIGRVEVTSPDRQPPPAHQEIQRPALGLADYLKQRERG